jgi:plasmid maintenance system killer protein
VRGLRQDSCTQNRHSRSCEENTCRTLECGAVRAKKIQTRIKNLRAAETLADMRTLPGRCHELTGDRAGQLSLDLDHPYRLLFRPAEETEPRPGGGLDWSKVTAVVIMSITDTH